MRLDLAAPQLLQRAAEKPWMRAGDYWPQMTEAVRHLSAPVAAIGVEALAFNAHDMLRRARGVPLRVATKSIRVRGVLESVLALPGYRGVMAYTLAEAVWLSETIEDVLVAYPSADHAAIDALASDSQSADRVTVMIDSLEQLDMIDSVTNPSKRSVIRVCLDFDASWNSKVLGSIGVLRSPVHEPEALRLLAEEVQRRDGFELVGVMSYEAQIAGVADQPVGNPIKGAILRSVQRRSADELTERRAQAIEAVRAVADLRFVNGGGTGSIERTAAEAATGTVTEIAVGSGLFGPHLFDHYSTFSPAPAAAFCLDVVRRPNDRTATLLGGGWVASGATGQDRLPLTVWPEGLGYSSREGAGEVQTPVIGRNAGRLSVGDRVWLRHTKSGELMEHVNDAVPVRVLPDGGGRSSSLEPMPTYRGEGKSFV